jgi:hypothetical protein
MGKAAGGPNAAEAKMQQQQQHKSKQAASDLSFCTHFILVLFKLFFSLHFSATTQTENILSHLPKSIKGYATESPPEMAHESRCYTRPATKSQKPKSKATANEVASSHPDITSSPLANAQH